jgi:hypothetical protein
MRNRAGVPAIGSSCVPGGASRGGRVSTFLAWFDGVGVRLLKMDSSKLRKVVYQTPHLPEIDW